MRLSMIQTRKTWNLLIAGAVITAGIGACVADRPVPPAPVATATAPQEAPTAAAAPAPPAAAPAPHDHAAEATVSRMTASELRTAMDNGGVVVIDVRDIRSYTAGHIPGALHIPLASLQAQVASLPKDKTVVAYCT